LKRREAEEDAGGIRKEGDQWGLKMGTPAGEREDGFD